MSCGQGRRAVHTVVGGQIKRTLLHCSGPCLVRAHELYCWDRATEVYLMVRTVEPYCKVIVLHSLVRPPEVF